MNSATKQPLLPTDKNIWVIIPGLNEAAHLKQALTEVRKYTPNIIFVDDGSSDNSSTVAQSCGVRTLKHRINLGKGAALRTGCDYAFQKLAATAVIFFDADLQHKADELPLFFHQLSAGANVIFGQRAMGAEMPLIRIMGNRVLSFLVLLFFHQYVPDIPCGFKAMTKQTFDQLKLTNSDYGIELEIAAKVAHQKIPFTTVEISTVYHEMNRGMTFLDGIKVVWYLLRLRFNL